MRSIVMGTLLGAIVGTSATATAVAQGRGLRPTREFVQAAAQSDSFETMEATTALAQSADPEVRAFAQRMIADHGTTFRRLRDAAERAGYEPPVSGLGNDQAAMLAALQSARGTAFDQLYWHQQALAHGAALVEVQRYAAAGDDPTVRAAAVAIVPTIQGHLAMATRMAAQPKPAAAGGLAK